MWEFREIRLWIICHELENYTMGQKLYGNFNMIMKYCFKGSLEGIICSVNGELTLT